MKSYLEDIPLNFFICFVEVLTALVDSEAQSIGAAKEAVHQEGVAASLAFIQANFRHLPESIKKLETQGVQLIEAFSIVEYCTSQEIPGTIGAAYHKKIQAVLARNLGYEAIQSLVVVHRGEPATTVLPWEPAAMASIKFAPITTCDVERSFSMYKRLLRDDRKNLTMQNIEKHMVVYSYKRK